MLVSSTQAFAQIDPDSTGKTLNGTSLNKSFSSLDRINMQMAPLLELASLLEQRGARVEMRTVEFKGGFTLTILVDKKELEVIVYEY